MNRKTDKKRIILLDSHAIIHRAYHALEKAEMTGPDGEPTGALYGLVAMLLKIITDLKPDYIAACYDLPKPTIRHEAYSDYKSSRMKTDDALARQLGESRKVFAAFSIPLYEREGFEADDLLGTIVRELEQDKDTDVIIASGDMDTLQLVDKKRVQVYTLKKGIQDTMLYDERAVIDRFGFVPALIPDYKGLRGDPSDNIKGIPGIGEKTATDLITQFGSIDDIYIALKKKNGAEAFLKKGIKPRIITLLQEHEEDARFSKSLATIRLDAPIAFSLPQNVWRENVRIDAMIALCDRLGFRSLKVRIKTLFGPSKSEELQEEDAARDEEIEDTRFREAQIMLWLISSEFTNPTLDDILAFAKERTFDAAYAELEKQISKLGRVADI